MDFVSDASKPGCSNNPGCSKYPLNKHRKEYTDDLIIIDTDDSNDSAYETGSSLSRSSQSSPISDIQESKDLAVKIANRRSRILYYANVNCDHNFIGPWQLVTFIQESITSKPIVNISDTVVISDSDDDENNQISLPKPLTMSNSIVPAKSNTDCDVISLDSDDEESYSEPMKYFVVECADGTIKKISQPYIANAAAPESVLVKKTRVIARRKNERMPYVFSRYDDTFVNMYANDEDAFYAGIISDHKFIENGIWYHLVFFDDGHVQHVPIEDIRVVFGNYGLKYVHLNAQRFYDYYFNGVNKATLIELNFKLNGRVFVFLNGEFESAEVEDYDPNRPGLVLLRYQKSRYAEYIYVGSPRFEKIWASIVKNKKLEKYHDANATLIEVSSDSEEEEDYHSPQKQAIPSNARDPSQKVVMLKPTLLIDNYKPSRKLDRRHICGPDCVQEFEQNDKIFEFDPLKRPLLAGWTRNITGLCHYVAPCGRSFNTIEAVHKYLITTKSKLTVDCFTFSTNIECMSEVRSYSTTGRLDFLNDLISGGWREKRQIPVVSIGANVPHFKEYVTRYRRNPRSKKVPAILNQVENPFRSGCDCVDDCSVKSKCSCWQLTRANSNRSIGYKYRRLDDKVDTGIYECNPSCKCSIRCLNRVVSAEIEQMLELYETKDRGYGIRCQTDLPKGTFISCYFGDLLHGKTADERAMIKVGSIHGDEYFMQLDHIEMAEQYKDGYESDVEMDDLDKTPMKRQRLDDSFKRTPHAICTTKEVLDYFPNISKKKQTIEVTQRTELYGENAVEFVVDGRFRGNISRFFNHSCSPNLFSQTVFVDTHDLRFPWLAFFASYDIKAGTELTWDYNYAIGSIEGRQIECKCGAPNCRKRLL